MPIVQPEVTGTTRSITIELPADLALRTRAYAEMAKARIDTVVRVALARLLEEDKPELEAFLAENPKALDGRKLGPKNRIPSGSSKKPAAPAAS